MVTESDVGGDYGIVGLIDDAKQFARENTSALVGGALVGGAVVGASALIYSKTKKKAKARTTKGRRRDRKFISKQKHERAYQKSRRKKGKKTTGKKYKTKSKSKKGIHYTKNGQPYKILSNGRARFIKK